MGVLRTGLIRLCILALLGAGGGTLWYLNEWVSPERVRQALLTALEQKLPGVKIELDSAGVRLFGGVTVENLRLTLPGETEPFFEAPLARIAHNKESLSRGVLEIRKIEFENPTVRLVRRADGRWNLSDLAVPRDRQTEELPTIPTLSIRQGWLTLRDESIPGGVSFVLQPMDLELVNDPVALLKIETNFTLSPLQQGQPVEAFRVPVGLSLKLNRLDGAATARVEIPELQIQPELAPALARFEPSWADYLSRGRATVGIKAEVKRDAAGTVKHDLKVEVRDGRYEDDALPWPVEQVHGQLQLKDGQLKVSQLQARFGKANVDLMLETRSSANAIAPPVEVPPPAEANPPATPPLNPEGHFEEPWASLAEVTEKLSLNIRELTLDDELFAKLPASAHEARQRFQPHGTVDLGVVWTRTPQGLKQELEVRPNRASMCYEKFRYPIQELSGFVRKVSWPGSPEEFRVQMTGSAGGRRIELTGRVGTTEPDPLIELKLTGVDIPIDGTLFAAMPKKYTESLGKLRAGGRGDFHVEIRQAAGVNRCESTIRVHVHDGQVQYDYFPYPLRNIQGQVTIRIVAIAPDRPIQPGYPLTEVVDTDRVELRKFVATHGDGKLWLEGDSDPIPGTKDRKLKLRIQGENLPFDQDFRTALSRLPEVDLWQLLSPRGVFTFGADLEVIERGAAPPNPTDILARSPSSFVQPAAAVLLPGDPPFNPLTDFKITVQFKGPTITPKFAGIDLEQVAGVVSYTGGHVNLAWMEATYAGSSLRLDAANIILADSGELWANLGGFQMRPFQLDARLLQALPAHARSGLQKLKLRGPMDLNVKHCVMSLGRPAPPPPVSLSGPLRPAGVARAQAPVVSPNLGSSSSPDSTLTPTMPSPWGATSPGQDLVLYWNLELKLHGASCDTGIPWTNLHGSLASVGRYERGHLESMLGNLWLDRVTIAEQPVSQLKCSYRARPQPSDPARLNAANAVSPVILEIPDLSAQMYQGTLAGEAWVSLAEEAQFRLWLNGAGLKLEEMATTHGLARGGELSGLVQCKMLLETKPDATTGRSVVTGSGQVDVPHGRLYNLPVLMPLLKLMKFQTPDQTAFEEAHAQFTLIGDQLTVTQLDLIGSALSLGGAGELDLRGEEVRFEFYTIWSQALKRWLTTPFGDVQSFLSGNLFRIDMIKPRGGIMEYRPQMLPVVTDPVKIVAERLRNRFGPAR